MCCSWSPGPSRAEIARIQRELETVAADGEAAGAWLAGAMEASWTVAEGLLDFPELSDLFAERHSLIAHDWQNATMLLLVSRQLRRANAILARVDFTTAGLCGDLAGGRYAVGWVFSVAGLIDQAADLTVQSATLVRQNERKWGIFHDRVGELIGEEGQGP